ncbi:MAG: zinc-binding alcohol dehydrogenase [Hyphomicrobiaceae bacterium]
MNDPATTQKRRSTAQRHVSRALWYVRAGHAELRIASLPHLNPDQARVRTQYSGISRGTERLILTGAVPPAEYERMRAPLQEGTFPFPVKYGYCAAGIVEDGPDELQGKPVFCLHPHQDVFIAPLSMLVPLPDGLTTRRATLAANMETALNALWDSAAGPGDAIVVVGAGILGLLVASLAASIPGTDVTVVDPVTERAPLVASLGAKFAAPDGAPTGADVVFHTSASAHGFNTAIACAGLEATVIELSWYGEKSIPASLGGAFHSRRLRLISSQVGQVSPSRRPRWTYRRRLEKALLLLQNPVYDALVAQDIPFDDLPSRLPEVLTGTSTSLPPVIRYPHS